ncbi:MAG: class I SAM-dependent methyltransferase, partial [Sulfurimonas sp.]|nr:class I SAM-dependent methyltransferase [Sulfurimonas sp.]
HENDVNDKGYQKFISPISDAILKDFTKDAKVLDCDAGTGPVLSKVLQDNNYTVKQYDPYFYNYPELLEQSYDYIGSCEVIEHFYDPYKEFKLLKKISNPSAKIYLMTEIYNEGIDFASWYYKNDPTHVFFYTKETFEWIKNEFAFKDVIINKRLIIFRN